MTAQSQQPITTTTPLLPPITSPPLPRSVITHKPAVPGLAPVMTSPATVMTSPTTLLTSPSTLMTTPSISNLRPVMPAQNLRLVSTAGPTVLLPSSLTASGHTLSGIGQTRTSLISTSAQVTNTSAGHLLTSGGQILANSGRSILTSSGHIIGSGGLTQVVGQPGQASLSSGSGGLVPSAGLVPIPQSQLQTSQQCINPALPDLKQRLVPVSIFFLLI